MLNIRVTVDDIKKTIIKEQSEEKLINDIKIQEFKIELWMIETFFLTLFCIIIGGLYFYGVKKENEKKYKSIKKNYMKEHEDYDLAESEMEYLIKKEEIENSYHRIEDEQE